MRITLTTLVGGNQHAGLEVDRHYAVHHGPDPKGRVWVFDDNTDSFRALGPAEYREVPDPLEPHDLVRINQRADGFWAVCVCVWRHWQPASDPDEAVRSFRRHLDRMDMDRRLLTMAVHPLVQQWLNDLRARRRHQEPER
jgi:hypothetical protein